MSIISAQPIVWLALCLPSWVFVDMAERPALPTELPYFIVAGLPAASQGGSHDSQKIGPLMIGTLRACNSITWYSSPARPRI